MSLIYPNIVPQNDLRLPDALTIKHGPRDLLARFVLLADKAARAEGVRLRLRHDFDTLMAVNQERRAKGDWFKLANMFDPTFGGISPENAFWVSGENDEGEIVLTQAGRVYYWPDTSLAAEARLMFYGGRDIGQDCIVTAETARTITGVVYYSGGLWVHPAFRGRGFSRLMPRIGRAYASARWPLDWGMTFVFPALVENGIAAGYGYRDVSYSVRFPGSPWGDLEFAVVRLERDEIYRDLNAFLLSDLAPTGSAVVDAASSARISGTSDERVTRTSPEPVLHGSSSLS